jgi:serine/threonine-protein kinase
MSVVPGTLIAKKYRVERLIGEGGMGVVVAARHVELGRRVAIKLVRKDAIDAGSVERLLREARAAAAIESQHVARVLDVGRSKGGEPYLVLEHLDGHDLHAHLASGPPPRVSDAVSWILQACEGLAAAHARGIVHRDLKPSNLFLTRLPDGREIVKLLDFGLAKSITSDDGRITATGAILGSPSYMSPEHLSGRPLDARSDIWSLGVTLYELLARELPFVGGTTPQICAAVLSSPPVPIASRRHDVPEELVRVIDACLEKDPEMRPRDVADLAARLEPFCDGAIGSAARVASTLEKAGVEAPLTFSEPHESPTHLVSAVDAPPRVRSVATIAVAALVAVGLVITVVAFVSRAKRPIETAAPPPQVSTAAPVQSPSAVVIDTVTIAAPPASTSKPTSKPTARPRPTAHASASSGPLERF